MNKLQELYDRIEKLMAQYDEDAHNTMLDDDMRIYMGYMLKTNLLYVSMVKIENYGFESNIGASWASLKNDIMKLKEKYQQLHKECTEENSSFKYKTYVEILDELKNEMDKIDEEEM